MNIVFAGTPEFAAKILEGLLKAKLNITAVFSQPDRPKGRGKKIQKTPTKLVAQKYNLPVYQPINFKNDEDLRLLKDLKPDLMIVVAYGLILPQTVLNIPTHGCINIHGSILPKYRGAAPVQHAILNGEIETGITIFQLDKGMDSGDILSISKCPIETTDTTKSILDKFVPISIKATLDLVLAIEKGSNNNSFEKIITKIKQDHSLATFAPKINKQDGLIDWNLSAYEINCKIRAFYPWPCAFFKLNENNIHKSNDETTAENVKVIEAFIVNNKNQNEIKNKIQSENEHKNTKQKQTNQTGKITEINKNGIIFTTGDGLLCLTKLQFPGSKVLNASDIINSEKYKKKLEVLNATV